MNIFINYYNNYTKDSEDDGAKSHSSQSEHQHDQLMISPTTSQREIKSQIFSRSSKLINSHEFKQLKIRWNSKTNETA